MHAGKWMLRLSPASSPDSRKRRGKKEMGPNTNILLNFGEQRYIYGEGIRQSKHAISYLIFSGYSFNHSRSLFHWCN